MVFQPTDQRPKTCVAVLGQGKKDIESASGIDHSINAESSINIQKSERDHNLPIEKSIHSTARYKCRAPSDRTINSIKRTQTAPPQDTVIDWDKVSRASKFDHVEYLYLKVPDTSSESDGELYQRNQNRAHKSIYNRGFNFQMMIYCF